MGSLLKSRWRVAVLVAACATLILTFAVRPRAVPLTTAATIQNFDAIGTGATATMPADFRVDKLAAARTVGTYAAALSATERAGGANLSGSASNGIYNFGAGTTTTGSDRAIGFLSSGSGTVSGNLYVKLSNTTASPLGTLTISYNVEKYRTGTNSNGFRVQLFYSFDGTTWTNAGPDFLTAFGADGTTAGYATAPGVTVPVAGKRLNAVIPAGSDFYLAWNYSVSAGSSGTSAQALAIDDISIAASDTVPPHGVGAATPAAVSAGETTTLTVAVTPGSNPPSTDLAVKADLTSLGKTATEAFSDDGTNGDATAGDNTFSYQITVPAGTAAGAKSLPVTITDGQSRSGTTSISLQVLPPFVPIHDIQGAGPVSPYDQQLVLTAGIVTGLKTNGFFIQAADADGDGNPVTSEGVFVFTSSAPPLAATRGNLVNVTGTVQEYNSMTEISGSPTVTLVSSGHELPAAITLTTTDLNPANPIDYLERYEGMRVQVDALTVVAPSGGTTKSNGLFYGVLPEASRPFREPGLEPDAPAISGMPAGAPRFDGNPERIQVDSDALGAQPIEVTTGATVSGGLVGPLDYSGWYTIDPESTPTVTGNITATAVPEVGDGQFTVASWNMLNFTATATRLAKASLVIRTVMRMPDIIGVEEMKDLPTLQAVADKVNADEVAAGHASPGYTAYLEGTDSAQNVGFLVRSSVVNPQVTEEGRTATFIDPRSGTPATLNDRPPLVLRGQVTGSAGDAYPITVIVNHLRSLIDVATPGGTGDFARAKRRAGAEYLAGLIAQYQANGEHVVSVGDYNAYQFNDGYVDVINTVLGNPTPADNVLLASPDLIDPNAADLVDLATPAQRYSYIENGSAQTIDHVIVSANVLPAVAGIAYGRVDADFPGSYQSDASRPERTSDHDPVVAYFKFPADLSAGISVAPADPVYSGSTLTYTVTAANGAAGDAVGLSVTTTLPSEMTVSKVQAPAEWTCTTTPGTTSSTVTCTTGVLAGHTDATFTITADLKCLMADSELTASVKVEASGTYDPDDSNNAKHVHTTVSDPAPAITDASPSATSLWPVDHKMVSVDVAYSVSDNCGAAPVCSLAVSSSEATDGRGDGQTATDWTVLDAHKVLLRAERSGTSTGRTYTVTISCTDAAGHTGSKNVYVTVPKSQGKQQ